MKWVTLVFFVGLLWISLWKTCFSEQRLCDKCKNCFRSENTKVVNRRQGVKVKWADICKEIPNNDRQRCIRQCLKMRIKGDAFLSFAKKCQIKRKIHLPVLKVKNEKGSPNLKENYEIDCMDPKICKGKTYNETACKELDPDEKKNDIIPVKGNETECFNCHDPAEEPEQELGDVGEILDIAPGEDVDAVQAANVMRNINNLTTSMKKSSAGFTIGEGVSGVLIKKTEPEDLDKVFFAFSLSEQNVSMKIIDDRDTLDQYSVSVTVTREAFEQAKTSVRTPFAALLQFTNLAKDEKNSTLLGNEVIAVEMGTNICNLTDRICINFRNIKHGGIPSCQSWDGEADICKEIPNNNRQRCKIQCPKMWIKDGAFLSFAKKCQIKQKIHLPVLKVKNESGSPNLKENYEIDCMDPKICEGKTYNETTCKELDPDEKKNYIIRVKGNETECFNCHDPAEEPEQELGDVGEILDIAPGEDVDAVQAANVMRNINNLTTSMKKSSAGFTIGEGVSGVLIKKTEPEDLDEVSFAFNLSEQNVSMKITDDRDTLDQYSVSVTVTREAFEQAKTSVRTPFAAVLRFTNLAKDEKNSTLLGNEVIAVEMGTNICNLTDRICINFRNIKHGGIPSCQSWDGEGSVPQWTDAGCVTMTHGENVTCSCSHLTFFAVLLTPLNETISVSDLRNLTMITQVGCGVSMLFLAVVLFMHCLLRRAKASSTTWMLVHLVLALFFLNFTFLINNFVAQLKSSVGCKTMAAVMHYFMLVTFTWFAAQAFNICLQLYSGGRTVVRHLTIKVCIICWGLPSVAGIVLFILGKYGEQVIRTDEPEENVDMCWITDNNIHYIVNISYYAVVFIFTFSTFTIILTWLICLKITNADNAKMGSSRRRILTILGLWCMLGISWGFAFFAYGVLLIPSYYIFTILNSFQGFFLFIYYYKTRYSEDKHRDDESSNTTSMSTSITEREAWENPYMNLPVLALGSKRKMEI